MRDCEICGDPVSHEEDELCDSCIVAVSMMLDRVNEEIPS